MPEIEVSPSLLTSGLAVEEDVSRVSPSPERMRRGPVAVIECFQRIPCDPCHASCLTGAIAPFVDINDIPRFDAEKCNGCGLCVAKCPGLAIFVVDASAGDGTAVVRLPYEFLPLPARGDEVAALGRDGREVCKGLVQRVIRGRCKMDTPVVWVKLPEQAAMQVRNIRAEAVRP